MNKLLDLMNNLIGSIVLAMWTFGGLLGVVYWAIYGQISYAVFSVIVPLFGATTIIMDLLQL